MQIFQHVAKIILLSLFLFPLNSFSARIVLSVDGKMDDRPATVYFPDGEKRTLVLDASGKGELTIDVTEPIYVSLSYFYPNLILHLTADTDLHIAQRATGHGAATSIGGKGAEINRYLNDGRLKATVINDTEWDEKHFLAVTDSLLSANLATLRAADLPEHFVRSEQDRLTYFTYATLPTYPYYHKRIAKDTAYVPTAAYWKKLEQLAVPHAALLNLSEYRTFMSEAVGLLATRRAPKSKRIDAVINYVEAQVADTAVAEYLIAEVISQHIRKSGPQAVASYRPVFYRHVHSPERVKAFEALCKDKEKLSVGAPSPTFRCTDVAGREVTLADFRGKYVYIDIWATWCGPCKREIPHLEKLAERFADKEIYFVSISCDQNREAWVKRVRSGMKGIQLHFVKDDTFMRDYMIKGIPYFILLDREGKIVEADMSRPSDPKTAQRIEQLFNE